MISNRVAVFAGPSRGECDAPVKFFPPASLGDLSNAACDSFETIIFADALFLDAAPTHKELIDLLKRGIRIFGCASSGALRAIELAGFGMQGYGCIYEMYRGGSLSDDGELATLLDSDFRPIAPPFIEIRYYLGYLIEQGMPTDMANAVMIDLSHIYYMVRTVDNILSSIERRRSSWNPPEGIKSINDPIFRLKEIDLDGCVRLALGDSRARMEKSADRTVNSTWMCNGIRLINEDQAPALNDND